jgi:hypothetical protein
MKESRKDYPLSLQVAGNNAKLLAKYCRRSKLSETDSFIEEVSEEVRRDKLFKLFKKYGWILALAVIVIVGGTAYNEWNKAQKQAEARLAGDLMRAALAAKDPAALAPLVETGSDSAVLAQLLQANLLLEAQDTAGALAALQAVANNSTAPVVYTDLAWLKIVMIDGEHMPENERNGAYDRLTQPDAPYRPLALEQRAMQYVREGNGEAAKTDLALILAGQSASPAMRNRAQQLIVALGGDASAGE